MEAKSVFEGENNMMRHNVFSNVQDHTEDEAFPPTPPPLPAPWEGEGKPQRTHKPRDQHAPHALTTRERGGEE